MIDQSDFSDDLLKEKLKALSDEEIEIKKWNEGLLIKSLILLPVVLFVVGLYIINRPENLKDILFTLTYPLVLISAGLIILFVMRSNLK